MLSAITQFANQSYGLPVPPTAKMVTTKGKPRYKVSFGIVATKKVSTKQYP